jgi:hypothetical protein
MLAETICCLFIAMAVSACALEASGMITALSGKSSHDGVTRALDYSSIIHEVNGRFETLPLAARGKWSASVSEVWTRKGMKVAEIAVVSENGENVRWKQWKIDGRE